MSDREPSFKRFSPPFERTDFSFCFFLAKFSTAFFFLNYPTKERFSKHRHKEIKHLSGEIPSRFLLSHKEAHPFFFPRLPLLWSELPWTSALLVDRRSEQTPDSASPIGSASVLFSFTSLLPLYHFSDPKSPAEKTFPRGSR